MPDLYNTYIRLKKHNSFQHTVVHEIEPHVYTIVIVPTCLLNLVAFFVFILPNEIKVRTDFSLAVILTYFVFFATIAEVDNALIKQTPAVLSYLLYSTLASVLMLLSSLLGLKLILLKKAVFEKRNGDMTPRHHLYFNRATKVVDCSFCVATM